MIRINIIASILSFFVGLGGLAGGLGAILNPYNPMGISVETLKKGPFTSFLIPGIVLFLVIGIGNIVAGIIIFAKKLHYYEYLSGVMGVIMIGWITIQCIILEDVNYLHIIFFGIGIIQGFLALILLYQKNMFPMNIVHTLINKKRSLDNRKNILSR